MTIETAHTESAREGPPLSQQIVSEIGERLAELGLSLCHIEWKKGRQRSVLTLTIDRPSGVTLHDCEGATRAVENLLEPVETLGESWVLEVESPGLDRRLYTLEDFRRFTGQKVRLELRTPLPASTPGVTKRARLKGPLESVDGDAVTILDEGSASRYTVRFGDVKIARLVPEF